MYEAVMRLIRRYVSSVPVDVKGIAERSGIALIPLTQICAGTGMSPGEVYAIWGNQDGVANAHKGRYAVAYNDTVPEVRRRFTVAEELMHIFLGHLSPEFNVYEQSYSDTLYRQCEKVAKVCAGMLLCPPKLYYTHEAYITAPTLAKLCEISEECAERAMSIYASPEVRRELCGSVEYGFMPVPAVPDWGGRLLWSDREKSDTIKYYY